jgi:predicted PurR-regulated permease PerM
MVPRRGAGALIVVAVLGLAAWLVAELLLVLFVAALIAVYLGSLTDHLSRRLRIPRGPGLVVSLLLTLGALYGLGALLAPAIAEQFQDLVDAVPKYVTALDHWVRGLATSYPFLRRTGMASSQTGVVTAAINDTIDFARRSLLAYATLGGQFLIESVAVLVMALYLALQPGLYERGVVQLVPPAWRGVVRPMLADVAATLRAWVGAQLLAMVVLATLTGIGLWALSVPYWLAFSAFTGVVVMVPFFGSIISTLIPALLILPDRGALAFLAVASVGIVVHIVEANIVQPLIMQHRVALPPVLTIFAVLVMGRLAGLLGLFVAVPALATGMVVVRHLLIYHTYGERPDAGAPPPAVLQRSREAQPAAR